MDTARNKKPIGLAMDPNLLDRLDQWISRQRFVSSRTVIIEQLVADFLNAEEKREAGKTVDD